MNERARRAQILIAGFGGARRTKRKRLPVQRWPKGIQRAYIKRTLQRTAAIEDSLQPLLSALPQLAAGAASRNRLDSAESDRIAALIRAAEAALFRSLEFDINSIEASSQNFARQIEAWQERELAKQVRSQFGIDVIGSDARLPGARDAFVQENTSLIKGLPGRSYAEIEAMTIREIEAGTLHKDLAKQLRARFGFNTTRAKLIARDQVGKYYGAVNKVRQQNMGVTRYTWRDSGDIRVRDSHVGFSGQVFKWGEAPEGDPGMPIQCRCYPEPVFDDILEGL